MILYLGDDIEKLQICENKMSSVRIEMVGTCLVSNKLRLIHGDSKYS